ncbi:MAG TPA: [protein-PII] uridylyltransferase [Microlunatus sp.]
MRSPWETTYGPDRRRYMSDCVEQALKDLWTAADGPSGGAALAAVGSLARRELGPRSDIDLVLLHNGRNRPQINALAEKLWYPLWDARVRLDHSVRTPAECADVAGRELSAGVGLLDLRLISGDADLVSGARTALFNTWRNNARKRLPELLGALDERLASFGDAAYLLEPDLKEARGGLRDMIMLRALAATWLTDRPHEGIHDPYERLLDVRDALHITSGRTLDRLLAAEVDDVARLLGFSETDELRREISLAARRIGHAVDITSRAARQAIVPERRVLSFVRRERKPVYEQAPYGLIVHQGEVGLDRLTTPDQPLLGLRAGALAAQRGLVLSPVTANNLGAHAPPIAAPWPEEAREALYGMLSAGHALLPVWESLDLAGCIVRWIPDWARISAQPQHNPIHRHTVDRHSVQCAAEVHKDLTQVERPDLLLLACLLHDIGKVRGAGADHAAVGAPIARRVAETLGLVEPDVAVIERLVRHHLTLAELATHRDHADPATLATLVDAVDGRLEMLNMLRRLTEADSRAAGPAAWSPWRAQLINALADRAEGQLIGEERESQTTELVDLGLARSVRLDGRPRVRFESKPGGMQIVIAARDRLGLFSEVAGLLASHAVSVRSAVLNTVEGVAVNTWRVDKQVAADLPDAAFLVKQMERLEAGDTDVLRAVRRREARAQARHPGTPFVAVIPDASETAAVVELRAGDRSGLLFALGQSLTAERLSVRSAHISTLAGQAIDTFYLTEVDGSRPSDERVNRTLDALTAAAGA